MKISVKLKHTELMSLVHLMEASIKTEQCFSRTDAIIAVIMLKMYKKLKEKTVMIEPRQYTFSIDVEVAMAFVEFYTNVPFDTTSHGGNVAQKLIMQFDRQTANFYSI